MGAILAVFRSAVSRWNLPFNSTQLMCLGLPLDFNTPSVSDALALSPQGYVMLICSQERR